MSTADHKKRLHTRYPGTLTVQVERDGVRRFGLLSQISLGGAFIEMSPPSPAGTRVTVIIMRSDGQSLRLPAESRYTRSEQLGFVDYTGMGIAWVNLDPSLREFVVQLVGRAKVAQPLRGGRDDPEPGEE